MRKITLLFLSFCCAVMLSAQETLPTVPGPVQVNDGTPVIVVINDVANVAAVPPGQYDRFSVVGDWENLDFAWSSEEELSVVTAAGATTPVGATAGAATNDDPTTLEFGDAVTPLALAGIYDPDVDGSLDLSLTRTYDSPSQYTNIVVTLYPTSYVPCTADAGTITADADTVELAGTTTISATPDGNSVVPTDFDVTYVLTSPGLVIEQAGPNPSFDVTTAGDYIIHTLVAETTDNTSPDFLDLSVIVFGTTTAVEVLNIVTANNLCASLDVAGAPITVSECIADAGTISPDNASVELVGTTTITATPDGNSVVPTDFDVTYVLTSPGLVIEQAGPAPSFDVTMADNYIIHTLVAETTDNTSPDFLDLSVIVFGTTTAVEVLNIITANNLCASLDAAGAPISVFEFTNDDFANAKPIVCDGTYGGSTTNATLDEDDAPDCCGADLDAPNTWYSYNSAVEGAADVTVSLCGSGYDTAILIYTGTSGNLTAVGGNDDFCALQSEATFAADGVQTYYVTVTGWNPTSTGNYILNVSCVATAPPPANDECANAEALTIGVQGSGTTEGATQNPGEEQPTCDAFGTIADVWYTVTTTDLGDLNITTAITGTSDQANVAVYTACGGLQADEIGCSDDNGGETLTLNNLAAGTYYVRVWSDGASPRLDPEIEGTFTITADFTLSNGQDLNNPSAFSYYPNPVENSLTLNAASNNIENVVMFNMLGQQVMQLQPNTLTSDLDMSNLQTGTYFVQVTVANVTKTIRVIKQ